MRSLQNYVDIYRTIANNNNLVGDSVEMLVQLLAQASYISEVENASYVQEASLEKAKLMNSKIQRCMDEMYSVFRGTCPRVILNIRPKTFFTFNMFDEIISSNSFKVYYLGIYDDESAQPAAFEDTDGVDQVAILENFKYGTATLAPTTDENKSYKILGLIASDISDSTWQVTNLRNYYFENIGDNLSNDMYVRVRLGSGTSDPEYWNVTRDFSDHIMENKIYDLTLPSFGSRIYIANVFQEGGAPENTILQARYFKYSTLSDYPKAELKKISLKGADFVDFSNDFLVTRNLAKLKNSVDKNGETVNLLDLNEAVISKGLIVIDSQNRDSIGTTHYKASRDRYINSLLRSNYDINNLLENMYPEVISKNGTTYRFTKDDGGHNFLYVYYAPIDDLKLLTEEEIEAYKKKVAFYIDSDELVVQKGHEYTALFQIDLELFQAISVDEEIEEILKTYEHKFGIKLNEKEEEIKALIAKISNVKSISEFNIVFIDEGGVSIDPNQISDIDNIDSVYFDITWNINSVVQTMSTK